MSQITNDLRLVRMHHTLSTVANIKLAWDVGDIIRKLRLQRGLSQEELAEAAGVHKNTIGRAEDGDEGVKSKTLKAIAQALQLTVADIYSLIPKETQRPAVAEADTSLAPTGTAGQRFRGAKKKK